MLRTFDRTFDRTLRRPFVWAMIPLLLLAFWLGARSLNADTVWLDELHSIEDSGGPTTGPLTLRQIWLRVAIGNPYHAPGYFMLLSGWGRVVGWEPPALRVMSLLFGMLTIAGIYRLGTDLRSPSVGLVAAAIMASSAFYAHFLHEMRVYTLHTFLTVLTLWLYLHLMNPRREPRRWEWLVWVGCVTAMLYAHYYAMLPLAALGLYHLLFVKKDRRWWLLTGGTVVGGLLFLPWVGALLAGLSRTSADAQLHERALSAGEAVRLIATMFSNNNLILLAVVLALVLTARGRGVRFVVFLTLVLLGLLLLTNELLQIMHGGRLRYTISMWPLLALVAAIGLLQLRLWRVLMVGVLALWIAFGLWNTVVADITAGLDGWQYVFPFHRITWGLHERTAPGDVIVNYLPDKGLEAVQYETTAHFYYSRMGLEYLVAKIPPGRYTQMQIDQLIDLVDDRQRVYVAWRPNPEPATVDLFEAALDDRFLRCAGGIQEPTLRLAVYVRDAGLCNLP